MILGPIDISWSKTFQIYYLIVDISSMVRRYGVEHDVTFKLIRHLYRLIFGVESVFGILNRSKLI